MREVARVCETGEGEDEVEKSCGLEVLMGVTEDVTCFIKKHVSMGYLPREGSLSLRFEREPMKLTTSDNPTTSY